jgi:YVTN family beta-propeller protein
MPPSNVGSIALPNSPRDIAVNPDTNTVYVSTTGSNQVYVIDGDSNRIVDIVTIGLNDTFPMGIAVNPDTNKVYVANSDSGTI